MTSESVYLLLVVVCDLSEQHTCSLIWVSDKNISYIVLKDGFIRKLDYKSLH